MTDVKLDHPGGQLSMPVREAVEGPGGIDVSALLKETGFVTLDQGFVNTASTTSTITYIDGDAGILRYRGYPIEQLAERSSFLEVSYLLMHDALPTPRQLKDFADKIRVHTLLQEEMRTFFSGFPRNAHPMAVLSSAVTALSTFYQDALDPLDPEQVEISGIRLMAKLPTIAAYAYKRSIGHPLPYPDNSLDYVENFMRMTFGLPTLQYDVDPKVAKILTCSSSCTPTTSRTAPRRPCGSSARPRRTSSPRSRPASTPSPARCTAAPTRRCSRCSSRSARTAATSPRSSPG